MNNLLKMGKNNNVAGSLSDGKPDETVTLTAIKALASGLSQYPLHHLL